MSFEVGVTSTSRYVTGPSALAGSPRRFLYLAATLALTEFKLRFFGSVLGYFWQLVRPLLLFGVLYFVFTEFVRIGDAVPFYPVVLLTNILLFSFFAEGTGAVASLVERENLVRKIDFPRLAVPVSVVLTATLNLALNVLVVLVFALASGVEPRAAWLAVPLLLAVLWAFTLGFASLLSALYVRFRDVKPIWDVMLQLLFYGTPVIYTIETIDKAPWVRELIMLNPLAAVLEEVRHALIDPAAPSAAVAAGGSLRLLIPAAIVVATLSIGLWVFHREAPRIAEEL
jgi:ABC-2 type transport system permease protein